MKKHCSLRCGTFPRAALLLAVILVVATSLFAAPSVGSITTLSGEVRIDAFGKGAFIPAIKGDLLYATTVLRSGKGGSADLLLGSTRSKLGPDASLRVADLLARQGTSPASLLGGFAELYKNVKKAAGSQSEVMLGTRAAEIGDFGTEWIEEDGPDEVLDEAEARLDAGDPRAALAAFDAGLVDAEAGQLRRGDAIKARAFFALGRYAEAEQTFASALDRSRDPQVGFADDEERARVLFGLGASLCLTGREGEALAPLAALLSKPLSAELDPLARLFSIRALAASGDRAGAASQLSAALARYRGTAYEPYFAGLASDS